MKKRVLSFLLACFMVVSTFIISRPLVDVHAVESDVTKWTMNPGAFYTGNGTDGPFQIGGFLDGSTKFTNVSAWVPVWNQTSHGQSNIPEASADQWIREHAWRSCETFAYDKSAGPELRVNPVSWSGSTDFTGTFSGVELAVAFTAPADGFYSYKEAVHSLGRNADETGTKQVIFKVKIGTTEHNTTNPDPYVDFEGTLKGIVELKKGDVLYFTANMYGTPTLSSADAAEHYCGAGIDELVIERLNEEDFETLEFSSDVTGAVCGTANAFTLRGYNHVTGEFLDDLTYSNSQASASGFTFFWISNSTGKFRMLPMSADSNDAGYDYSSVIEFTAPTAGEYLFDAQFRKEWEYNASSKARMSTDFLIVNSDMEVLNRDTTYDPVAEANGTRHGFTFDFGLRHSVYLDKGESVYLMTRVNENATVHSQDYCGAQIEYLNVICKTAHPCSAETLAKVPYTAPDCVAGTVGNLEHWKCSCGALYADAAATTVLYTRDVEIPVDEDAHAPATKWTTDETGHWYACNNGCDEKISYAAHVWANGVCSTCDYECRHTNRAAATCNTPETCTNCKVTFGEVDKSNHASAGAYVNTGKGTHRFNRICCDGTDIAEEACTYGDDKICDKCGYDNTALDNAETNKGNALDNYLNKDNADYEDKDVTVVGPQAGDLDDYGVTGNVIVGAEYKLFNIDFDENGNMFLRHHFIIENNAKVYLNGVEVTLNNVENTNIYYFDVTPVAGKYHVADAIKVVSGESEETYNVSLYSYLKVALLDKNVGQLSDKQLTLLKSLYDLNEAAKPKEQILVGMANQSKNQVQVYDITAGNMNNPIWTYTTAAGTISGFKFRNYAPYGDVLLTAAGKIAEIVSYDTKEVIWKTTDSSGNTHSIEILPNGIIVTGGTNSPDHATAPGCTLTFFNLHGENPSECILEVDFNDAHGVLWDPQYNVLWALGGKLLTAYEVDLNDDDGTVSLVKNEELSIVLPDVSGHDLQPYGKDVHKLMVSLHSGIFVVDKRTGEATMIVEQDSVKGIGILPTGELVYMHWDGVNDNSGGGWNTTWINRVDAEGNVTEIHSDQGRFYKLRVWDTDYQ